jgi:hypothetical protein
MPFMFPVSDRLHELTADVKRAYQAEYKNYRLSRFNIFGEELEFVERRYAKDVKQLHKEWVQVMLNDRVILHEMGADY